MIRYGSYEGGYGDVARFTMKSEIGLPGDFRPEGWHWFSPDDMESASNGWFSVSSDSVSNHSAWQAFSHFDDGRYFLTDTISRDSRCEMSFEFSGERNLSAISFEAMSWSDWSDDVQDANGGFDLELRGSEDGRNWNILDSVVVGYDYDRHVDGICYFSNAIPFDGSGLRGRPRIICRFNNGLRFGHYCLVFRINDYRSMKLVIRKMRLYESDALDSPVVHLPFDLVSRFSSADGSMVPSSSYGAAVSYADGRYCTIFNGNASLVYPACFPDGLRECFVSFFAKMPVDASGVMLSKSVNCFDVMASIEGTGDDMKRALAMKSARYEMNVELPLDDGWHHFAFCFGVEKALFYYDGMELWSSPGAGSVFANDNHAFSIGRRTFVDDGSQEQEHFFNGLKMSHLSIYDMCLEPWKVAREMSAWK